MGATCGAETAYLPEHLSSPPVSSGLLFFVLLCPKFLCEICRSLFVLLSFFFWPLYLSFFDL